jgi:hypothetical protein
MAHSQILNYKMHSLKKLRSEVLLQHLEQTKHGGKVGHLGNKLVFKKIVDHTKASRKNGTLFLSPKSSL